MPHTVFFMMVVLLLTNSFYRTLHSTGIYLFFLTNGHSFNRYLHYPNHNFSLLSFVFIISLFITGWLSYFISHSVYKSLKKNGNRYARLIQVLIAVGIFAVLLL